MKTSHILLETAFLDPIFIDSMRNCVTYAKYARFCGDFFSFRAVSEAVTGPRWAKGGSWTLDYSKSPTDPPKGGCWTLDSVESPRPPSKGGSWTLGSQKPSNLVQGGGGYIIVTTKICAVQSFSGTLSSHTRAPRPLHACAHLLPSVARLTGHVKETER